MARADLQTKRVVSQMGQVERIYGLFMPCRSSHKTRFSRCQNLKILSVLLQVLLWPKLIKLLSWNVLDLCMIAFKRAKGTASDQSAKEL